ncbi:MAG: choice-of-anchor B family protein [Acidobacteriota bacterium]
MRRSALGASLNLAVLIALALPAVSEACVMASRLRAIAPHLTEEQIMKIAHDPTHGELIPYKLDAPEACTDGMADIFPCDNVDLLAFLSPADLGGNRGNDLWAWTDPQTGKEYALMGLTNGTAFIDVSTPEAPIYLGRLPTHNGENSTWRDIAVYKDHAFIVADEVPTHGMQVFDLTQLRNIANPPVSFSATLRYTELNDGHNITINEATGFAYVVGGVTCSGGPHIIDVRDPTAPVQVGCFSGDGYTHDLECVTYDGPDTEHKGKEICLSSNEDTLTIIDVTIKDRPVMLSRTGYDNSGYIHQGSLTGDHRYFLIDDEADESIFNHNTRTYTFDVSDLDAPTLAGFYEADGVAIDHNQYVMGDYVYQANYARGLRILHLDDPSTGAMTEVAFLDTVPEGDMLGFSGAWSVYPYLSSGVVLISDRNRGLFVVRPRIPGTTLFEDSFESGTTDGWRNRQDCIEDAEEAAPAAGEAPASSSPGQPSAAPSGDAPAVDSATSRPVTSSEAGE